MRLAEVLQRVEMSAPGMPVVANVTGQPHEIDKLRERMALSKGGRSLLQGDGPA